MQTSMEATEALKTSSHQQLERQTTNLSQLAQAYQKIRSDRLELEKKASELKKVEEDMRLQILEVMSLNGFKTVNVDGVGRLTTRTTKHYEIRDANLFARAILQSIVDAVQSGRTFSDGLIVQRRVSREALEQYVSEKGIEDVREIGVIEAERTDLSLTRI